MPRTCDATFVLAQMIDAYQAQGHFCFQEDGKAYARIIMAEDDGQSKRSLSKVDFCLTDLATSIAERLSR